MNTRSRATTALLFATLLVAAAACDRQPTTAPDSGTPPADAAMASDAGDAIDAAVAPDIGMPPDASSPPVITIVTSMGTIDLELEPALAPIGTANFLRYVDQQFYDGTLFHRVIPDFMIQGGGYTEAFDEKNTEAPIKNEAGNGLKNLRGTVAYARTSVVDSATSQFFINVVDNAFLDHKDETASGYGYAVFGKVVAGMDVVDAIAVVPTMTDRWSSDVPVTPVVITTARRK